MPDATMRCDLCGSVWWFGAIVDHMEQAHPDVPQDATWPDGQHLVDDTTEMAWEAA